jgi:Tfp pilus assembly protein PilV
MFGLGSMKIRGRAGVARGNAFSPHLGVPSVVRARHADAGPVSGERGSSLLEVLIAVAVAATTVLGATSAQWFMRQAERTSQSRVRAALIADSALELMRAGQGEAEALEAARQDASRHLYDGAATISRNSAGASVLIVGWSEPAGACGDAPAQECAALVVPRPGYVARCVSVGYLS